MTISTPLDTLKAVTLRSHHLLDHVIDQLAGGEADVPEYLLDMLDDVKQILSEGICEHHPLIPDPHFPQLRKVLPPQAYRYDDGSPVVEYFKSQEGISSVYYPRYDGDRQKALQRHFDFVDAYRKHGEGQGLSDVAAVLVETDLKTVLEAQEQNDLSLIRLKDGERPSEEQLALIMQATSEHLHEASEEMRKRAVRAENAAWASQRSSDLMQKYDAQAGESLKEVALRMSVEDREEILSLGRILADDPLEEG